MDRKAALATAAGLVLVVAGAASALTAAWTRPGQGAPAGSTAATPTIVTEYVDEAGNPVAPPTGVQADTVVMTRSSQPQQVIVYQEPAPIIVQDPAVPVALESEHESEHESEEGEEESEHESEEGEEESEHESEEDEEESEHESEGR